MWLKLNLTYTTILIILAIVISILVLSFYPIVPKKPITPSPTTIAPIVYKREKTIYEYELAEMEKPYTVKGTPVPTYKPSTSYCNTLIQLNAMNYLIKDRELTPKERTEVLSLINTALKLNLQQRQLLVLLSNIQLQALIDINCLFSKNDPNYLNVTTYTNWDASYRNSVISNIYTLLQGPKIDYVYSTHSILPFLQSLTNQQLYDFIV